MRGVIGLLPGRQMALRVPAIRGSDLQVVIVVDVAVRASVHLAGRRQLVRTRQRKTGSAVIENRAQPGDGIVASRASRHRKGIRRSAVFGIASVLPRRQMALRVAAIGRRNLQVVVVVDMAGRARHIGVAVGQKKTGSAMVKFCAQPTVESVAGLAGLRKRSRYVIRIRGLLKIRLVAGNASRRESQELPHRRSLVTVVALHRRVGAQQREAVLVIFHLLRGNVPALHRVALRAVRAHLPLVNVGVAIFAILADIREHGLGVALGARHFFVHSPQRILRLIVVEFRYGPNGPPTRGRMTVLAGYRQRSVRTSRRLALIGKRTRNTRPHKQEEKQPECYLLSRNCPPKALLPSIRSDSAGASPGRRIPPVTENIVRAV